jgi:hypothetical protein
MPPDPAVRRALSRQGACRSIDFRPAAWEVSRQRGARRAVRPVSGNARDCSQYYQREMREGLWEISVRQIPSASARTSTAPSLAGGAGNSSNLIEFDSPGTTVRARIQISLRASPRSLSQTTRRSGRRFHGGYLISMHLAVFVANGDIFAWAKNMRAETVSAFVVIFRRLIVVEDPSTVLRSARTM